MRAKLQEIKTELRQRMHQSIPSQGHWLRQVVTGTSHTMPSPQIVGRSQRSGITWRPLAPHASAAQPERQLYVGPDDEAGPGWLPAPRLLHPWPDQRFAVKHPR
jgi:RNA-directed DNA polymerase